MTATSESRRNLAGVLLEEDMGVEHAFESWFAVHFREGLVWKEGGIHFVLRHVGLVIASFGSSAKK
jgi:hypothetical protein